jgi:hypothetical protein
MYGPPASVLIPRINKPGIKQRECGVGCVVLDERKRFGYLAAGPDGIPAANHAPVVFRMRSTGLVQVFGGAGESES